MKHALATILFSTLLYSSYTHAKISSYYDNYNLIIKAVAGDKELSTSLNTVAKLRTPNELDENAAFIVAKKEFVVDCDFDLINDDDFLKPQNIAFLLKTTNIRQIESGANSGKYSMNKFIGISFMGKKIGKDDFIGNVSMKVNRYDNKIVINLDMFDHSALFYDTVTKITFLRQNNDSILIKAMMVASLKRSSMIETGLRFEGWRKGTTENSTDKEIEMIASNLEILLKENL